MMIESFYISHGIDMRIMLKTCTPNNHIRYNGPLVE